MRVFLDLIVIFVAASVIHSAFQDIEEAAEEKKSKAANG